MEPTPLSLLERANNSSKTVSRKFAPVKKGIKSTSSQVETRIDPKENQSTISTETTFVAPEKSDSNALSILAHISSTSSSFSSSAPSSSSSSSSSSKDIVSNENGGDKINTKKKIPKPSMRTVQVQLPVSIPDNNEVLPNPTSSTSSIYPSIATNSTTLPPQSTSLDPNTHSLTSRLSPDTQNLDNQTYVNDTDNDSECDNKNQKSLTFRQVSQKRNNQQTDLNHATQTNKRMNATFKKSVDGVEPIIHLSSQYEESAVKTITIITEDNLLAEKMEKPIQRKNVKPKRKLSNMISDKHTDSKILSSARSRTARKANTPETEAKGVKKLRALSKLRAFLAENTDILAGKRNYEAMALKLSKTKAKRNAWILQRRIEPLPLSFGNISYKPITVYFKKKEEGLGLRLKIIDGKLVVKGLNIEPSDPLFGVVHIDDVILSVNHIDSRTASTDTLLNALKWKPRVEDDIKSVALEVMDNVIRVTFARPLSSTGVDQISMSENSK